MVEWIRFWFVSLSSAFGASWVVFGAVSTALPALIALIQRYCGERVANVRWLHFVAENQNELHVGIAAAVLIAYLAYAPYKLYRGREREITTLHGQVTVLNDEADGLRAELKRANATDQLGAIVAQLAQSTKKGALPNRANTFSKELIELVERYTRASSEITEQWDAQLRRARQLGDKEGTDKAFQVMVQASSTKTDEFTREFMASYAPRMIALIDEFRAEGLTDPELDNWRSHPHGAALRITCTDLATRIATLAIQLEQRQ